MTYSFLVTHAFTVPRALHPLRDLRVHLVLFSLLLKNAQNLRCITDLPHTDSLSLCQDTSLFHFLFSLDIES